MNTSKFVNIAELSAQIGLPVRTLRSLAQSRKIPQIRLGHRTLVFDPNKVRAALEKFEVRAVAS